MQDPTPIRATLELGTDSSRVALVLEGQTTARRFSGWLELATTIETWRGVFHEARAEGVSPFPVWIRLPCPS